MPTSTKTSHLTIKSLHFQGFKSIEDLRVDLEKGLNIVIGTNGSGKSNFLECIYHSLLSITIENTPPYALAELSISSDNDHLYLFEFIRSNQRPIQFEDGFANRTSFNRKLTIDGQPVYDDFSEEKNSYFFFNNNKIQTKGNISSILQSLKFYVGTPLYIQFNIQNNLEFIDTSGSINLQHSKNISGEIHSTLNFLDYILFKLEFASDFSALVGSEKVSAKTTLIKELRIDEDILRNLANYSPVQSVRFNENIGIYNNGNAIVIDNLKLEFKINNSWLPWSQLSDGTKRLFCLIAEVSFKKSGVVLIEEPELGVHPHQFNLLMTFLKEQAETKQIIITTHSPKALDILNESELENILLVSYTKKLGTQIDHLSATQKKKASRYMKEVGFLSDYWLMSNLEND